MDSSPQEYTKFGPAPYRENEKWCPLATLIMNAGTDWKQSTWKIQKIDFPQTFVTRILSSNWSQNSFDDFEGKSKRSWPLQIV